MTIREKIRQLQENIKLNLVTSQFNRNRNLKLVKNQIKNLDSNNINEINEIIACISRLDLYDDRFGKRLDYKLLEDFENKISNNPNAKSCAEEINAFMSCYKESKNKNADKGIELGE